MIVGEDLDFLTLCCVVLTPLRAFAFNWWYFTLIAYFHADGGYLSGIWVLFGRR